MKWSIALTLLASVGYAHAEDRHLDKMTPNQFDAADVSRLSDQKFQFASTGKIVPFKDWAAERPTELEFLGLYPNYKEPALLPGQRADDAGLEVYVIKSRTLVNVSAENLNLSALRQPERLNLDKEISVEQINPDQTLPALLAAHAPINRFHGQGCGNNAIMRPTKEKDLSELGAHPWCKSANSVCIESCYQFPMLVKATAMVLANTIKSGLDPAVGFQSELSVYKSESEYPVARQFSQLTKVQSSIVAIIEEKSFYFSEAAQFANLLLVLQKSSSPNQLILTSYFVMAVKHHTLTEFPFLRATMENGLTKVPGFDAPGGLLQGIPKYAVNMMNKMIPIIEQGIPSN